VADVEARPEAAVQPVATGDKYVIGCSDVLDISVWKEADLAKTQVVRSDGMISLPLLGDIKAEGLNVEGLRELLTKRYEVFVDAPEVTVVVTVANSSRFFVLGRVMKPGEYPLTKETSMVQAIAAAGGFAQWAKTGHITVIRKTADGQRQLRVNYDAIAEGSDLGQNITLQPGDTIIVP